MEETSDGATATLPVICGPANGNTVLRVFTDGMSMHSGTKSHIGVYSVWIEENHPDNNAWWTKDGTITNQSMELAGANAGLDMICKASSTLSNIPTQNILYSTSHYVMNCMTEWLPRWKRTGWITKQRRPVHNGVILKRMANMACAHDVHFVRVPPEQLNENEADASTAPDPSILHGMKQARRALFEAAAEGLQSGCVKQRGSVTCEWSGGG